MCDTCSKTATNVLKMDFYSQMAAKRDEILDDEEMKEVFGEAFEELIQNYAMFIQKVFDGHFEPESIERRQKQWEERLEMLVYQITHEGQEEEVEEEPQQEEPMRDVKPLIIGSVAAKNPSPFKAWLDKNS